MGKQATQRSIAVEVRKTLDTKAAAASASPGVAKVIKQKVAAVIAKITPERILRDKQFKRAAAAFPEFCHEWEQKLRDREKNNLEHLVFQLKDGWQTATYTGYGKVNSCEAHQSKDGFAIGRLSYEEFIYYLTGQSTDEARHAPPKTTSDTHTTEIFRWDKEKWFF